MSLSRSHVKLKTDRISAAIITILIIKHTKQLNQEQRVDTVKYVFTIMNR